MDITSVKGRPLETLGTYCWPLSSCTYIRNRLFKYADKGYGLHFPLSYIMALGHDPWLVLSCASEKSRKWTTTCLEFYLHMLGAQKRLELRPTYSHSQLNSQMFDIPSHSNCLHNFTLFMRHISLWELDLRGTIRQVVAAHKDSHIKN